MSSHIGATPFSALDFFQNGKVHQYQVVSEIPGREPSENILFDLCTSPLPIQRALKSYRANSTLFTVLLSEPYYSRGLTFEPAYLSLPV